MSILLRELYLDFLTTNIKFKRGQDNKIYYRHRGFSSSWIPIRMWNTDYVDFMGCYFIGIQDE